MLAADVLVSPRDVCLDAGAAGGTWMWLLARKAGPGGTVHAFEPRPRSFAALGVAVRFLRLGTVQVHRVGLGDSEGVATMMVPSRWGIPFTTRSYLTGSDGPGKDGFTSRRSIQIPMTTVDRFVAQQGLDRVDVMKIDVEGSEPALLHGAAKTIGRWHPRILCEIEDRHLARYGRQASDVVGLLQGFGYRMHVFVDGRLVEADEVVPDENNYLFL